MKKKKARLEKENQDHEQKAEEIKGKINKIIGKYDNNEVDKPPICDPSTDPGCDKPKRADIKAIQKLKQEKAEWSQKA